MMKFGKERVEIEEWKKQNEIYLTEIQKFLDKADNIENEGLKQDIIHQMLRCDTVLTHMAEEMFAYWYQKGEDEARKKV